MHKIALIHQEIYSSWLSNLLQILNCLLRANYIPEGVSYKFYYQVSLTCKLITISIRNKLCPSYNTKLIKYQKIIASTIGEYIYSKSMTIITKAPKQQVVPYISKFHQSQFCFCTKTYLYPTRFTSYGVGTRSLKSFSLYKQV